MEEDNMGQKYIRDEKSLEAIKNYLNENGIVVLENFDKEIITAARKFNNGKLPSVTAIENVLKICKYWKKYCVSEEDYHMLVCKKCYEMARIQCAVISSLEEQQSSINLYCQVKKEQLPEFTTNVANHVRAFVYEGMGSIQRVF